MRSILLSLLFIAGCSASQKEGNMVFDEISVSETSLIVSAETHSEIGAPSFIRTTRDGFLIYDFGAQNIHKYDPNGNYQLSFGQEGEGPGEFQSVANIWEFEDSYMLYNYRGAKLIRYRTDGTFLEDIAIEGQSFSTALEAVSPHQYYAPSNGEQGSLLQFIDMEIDTVQHIGEALGKKEETVDFGQARQDISSGRVPAFMQNQVSLSSNDFGVFSFQQTTALLQKYTHSGELAWEIDLQIPAVDGIFEHFLNINKSMMENGRIVMLYYANHMEATENGVAVLLNTLDDKPVTMVWLSNDGKEGAIITYTGFEPKPRIFSISSNESSIYFVNTFDGEVHKSHWPVN